MMVLALLSWEGDFSPLFIMPIVVICFLVTAIVYTRVYLEVRRHQRLESEQNLQAKKNKRAFCTTVLSLLAFVVCWFPNVIVQVYYQIYHPRRNPYNDPNKIFLLLTIRILGGSTMLLNGLFDPLIYALRLKEVRAIWRKTWCCCCKKNLQVRLKSGRFCAACPRKI